MIFADFIGQAHWQAYFTSLITEGRYAHAYLFSGSRHLGKRAFVNIISRSLLCGNSMANGEACSKCSSCLAWRVDEHLDLLRLKLSVEASSIGVAEVRKFVIDLQRTPFEAKKRVAIIEDLDRMTIEGLNVLLKTLEEPPAYAVLFLIVDAAESLPATVRSRLQHCLFFPVPRSALAKALVKNGVAHDKANELAALSNGRPGLIFHWRENPAELKSYQVAAQHFLGLCESSLKEKFGFTEDIVQTSDSSLLGIKGMLAHWRLVVRDFLYLDLNEPELVTHIFLRPKLDEIAAKKRPVEWLARYDGIERTEQMINRNANRRLALNNFFLSL